MLSADATAYQILRRNDQKPATSQSRIWLFRTSEHQAKPIVLYHSAETHKFEVAQKFLSDFSGYLHRDGYSVYQKLDDVTLQSCWAHVRCKFLETRDNKGQGKAGAVDCDQLFDLERQWRTLSPTERLKERQAHAKPLVATFFQWLDTLNPMKEALQKACQ